MNSRALGVVAIAVAAPAVSLVFSGPAQASSPNVVGQKYGDASTTLSGAGYTPVVRTTVGDRLAWSDCVVTNQVDHTEQPAPNSSGSAVNQTLVSLNCDAAVASAKAPGNSLGSPEGRAAAAAAKTSTTPTPAAPAG
ncbi:hypothetical protein A5784_09375 [Mycobacterium sp. 852013-50091_SCH5140682]|uniref:hypothetical protein n=1 Tax=Mycobacterium sp. 852013-50091_SCH5140682 TaxID=1834109 RepID=UPI0007E9FAE7|nr:hypothetical protein [Mycobacterium sp. 852013-50091_SCH5140682]OBC06958.1 hypothetical protein A5784_09375 [Mycobacterium sp. 852013-50091_SCH5140682]